MFPKELRRKLDIYSLNYMHSLKEQFSVLSNSYYKEKGRVFEMKSS